MSLKKKFILISKKKKIKYLTVGAHFKAGRNNSGKITVRHRGSKIKKKYMVIDVYRAIWHVTFFIIKFEYDANRKTLLSRISYSIGILSYVIATEDTKLFSKFMNGIFIKKKIGNSAPIFCIKKNALINGLEIKPFNGLKLLKSAGAYGKLLKKKFSIATIKLKSGKLKKINSYCMVTIGKIMNFNYYLQRRKKAGFSRLKNKRPSVRGVAMNPIDHPYGGGEGKKSKKSILMSPWGKVYKYKKTK